MKLKYIAIVYTVILIILGTLGISKYNEKADMELDTTLYHKLQVEVQKALEKGEDVEDIIKDYDCQLIRTDDEQYATVLWDSISGGASTIDIVRSDGTLYGKLIFDSLEKSYEKVHLRLWRTIIIFGVVIGVAGYLLMLYEYITVIKPFRNLQSFAANISKGNLDVPLPMTKDNYFGAFTESFDIMREELKSAKEKEFIANQSKKELVAELSHDIKTPVSTIKANCELLQAMPLDEVTKQKAAVINSKAETIEQLIDNMFHATLEELTMLKVEPKEVGTDCILTMLDELRSYGDIRVENELPKCLVWMDKLRFTQVVDNIIFNSYKYGKMPVKVSFSREEAGIMVKIADSGDGIPEADLSRVTQKFFRGQNAEGQSGSGLGLFLAETFMKQMDGDMAYYNENGFVVELFLKSV